MNEQITAFIDCYVKEIANDNAAIFAGAGFSRDAGFVNWQELLEGIAKEIGLDSSKEINLVALAQYHCNKYNRNKINTTIFNAFSSNGEIDENHRILARLPIFTYWTTNYDSLIEDALRAEKKVVDVKRKDNDLCLVSAGRDAVVYKMHGDKNSPDEAIIIKDDYESYYKKHGPFLTALSGDLLSKTFLFLGFSFSDPNIDYVLSRLRVENGSNNQRQHYAIMRNVKRTEFKSKADYTYAKCKQDLIIDDMRRRYNITVLLVDDYSEITEILRSIEKKLFRNNIFISGSAKEFGAFTETEAQEFITTLSSRLVKKGYNIISGFGLGVGSSVITGALKEIYSISNATIKNDKLILRPFPQDIQDQDMRKKLFTQYREDMISRAGISVFVFGNRTRKDDHDQVENAYGVVEEFEIAKKFNNLIVPVGCTGWVAKEIWEDVNKNFQQYYPGSDGQLLNCFKKLDQKTDPDKLATAVIEFIDKISLGS